MTITRKLVLTYILIAIFPTVVITLVSLHMMSNRFSEELARKGDVSLFEAGAFINNYFDEGQKIAGFLANSKELKGALASGTDQGGLEAVKDFIDIAVIEVFDINKTLFQRIYIDRKGTESIFTLPEDDILHQTLELDKVSRFYVAEDGLCIKISEPVIDTGTMDVMGAVIVSFPFNGTMIRYLKDSVKTDVSLFFPRTGRLISTIPGNRGRDLTRLWEGGISDVSLFSGDHITRNEKIASHYYTVTYDLIRDSLGDPVAILSTAINRDSIEKSRRNAYRVLLFSSGGVLVMVGIIGVFISRSITDPITKLLTSTRMITGGNLEADIDTNRRDELGVLAKGFAHMRDAVKKQISDLSGLNREIVRKNEKLEIYRNHLEELVRERTASLHAANRDLAGQVKERKKAEEKYRTIIENIEYGYYETDFDGKITFFNESMLKIFGCAGREMTGAEPCTFMDKANARSIVTVSRLVRDSRKALQGNQCEILRKDGKKRIVEFSCAPIRGEENSLEGFRGVVRDVTERVQVEEEMQRARQAAEESNNAKSEFIANMSHEIRTPLNAVIGFSELLSSLTMDLKQQSYIDAIKIAGKSLLTLINDILDLSKIEAGMLEIRKDSVCLRTLFDEILQIFREKVNDKNIRFIIDLDNDLPYSLKLDETRIRQILLNLVGNAVKFTENGHIHLAATARKKGAEKGKIDLFIAVEDTGLGIAEKDHDKIFHAFKQLDGSGTRKHSGTGLGLSICKRLVQAMNGRITVSSEKGRGSRFEMVFNDVEVEPDDGLLAAKTRHFDIENTLFEQKKILIVDDIESSRNLLKELLEKVNFTVLEAENGREAMGCIQKDRPDLVFMDIKMPVMDGRTAARKLKRSPETRALPVIALTADAVPKKEKNTPEQDFNGYLVKPFNADELLRELSRFFRYTVKQESREIVKTVKRLDTEKVDNPAGLISSLKDEILPWAKDMEEAMVMSQIERLGYRLKKLGETHRVDLLVGFSRDVVDAVKIYDVVGIKKKFRELTVIAGMLETELGKSRGPGR